MKLVKPGTLLLSYKLSIGKVGFAQIPMYTNEAIAALSDLASNLDSDFMYWALQHVDLLQGADRAAMGATLNKAKLSEIKFPVPPLVEQRRIAAILDKADLLRARRREATTKLDQLLQSVFFEMFGDLKDSKGWPRRKFGELCSETFRNGLSPSAAGRVRGQVLTLTAVTGDKFDSSFRKEAVFDRQPSSNQLLTTDTFLICRGNGNKRFVGAGFFPDHASNEICFPDTMIGATVDQTRIDGEYLEMVWKSRFVREQIERGARTTNGTYKVNQSVLSNVEVPVPPIDEQRRFSAFSQAVLSSRRKMMAKSERLDSLFHGLQKLSFDGQFG